MAVREKKKAPFWVKLLMFLFIAASVFLILCGSLLLAVDAEATGAVICIAFGVIGLLFFGTCAYMSSHPNHPMVKGLLIGICGTIAGSLLLLVFVPMVFGLFLKPFASLEHYLQVWQNPVTVSAVVTDHDFYDDDGDTDYRSYITYVYDNIRYVDHLYEDRDKEGDLTPLGTSVTVQISPLDPSQQISRIMRSGSASPWTSLVLFAILAALCARLQQLGLAKHGCGTPDTETIKKDIKVKIRSRFLRPFLLLCWAGYSFLYWRYSILLSQTPLILAGISCAGWLYCMFTTIRDYRCGENGDFEVQRDILTDKKEYEDEGSYTYWLCYKCNDRTWKTKVKADVYARAKIGDSVIAVYLPGKKKPIVHYDPNGRAH